jgi:hypothetical protein
MDEAFDANNFVHIHTTTELSFYHLISRGHYAINIIGTASVQS